MYAITLKNIGEEHNNVVETEQRQVASVDVENLPTNDAMQALTERVSQKELHQRFVDAFGSAVRFHGVLDRKPLEVDLAAPRAIPESW